MAIPRRQTLCCLAILATTVSGCQKTPAGPESPAGNAPVDKAALSRAEVKVLGIGGSPVSGHLSLIALANGAGVQFTGQITGLTPGEHGIHVHEVGSCDSPDGMSAGGHFNPTSAPHGKRDAADSHVGDLGNLSVDAAGTGSLSVIKAAARLDGPATLVGRSIIVHQNADDFTSQPAGNSGPRVGCGVIRSL